MNGKKSNCNSRISEKSSEIPQSAASVPTSNSQIIEDVETSTQTTYESFFWFLFYAKMFVTRLGRDLFQSAKRYFYPNQVLPDHIIGLMKVHSDLCKERESRPTTYCRYNDAIRPSSIKSSAAHSIQSISLVPENTV